eukprot:5801881-Prymnesium_polylepis.3
MLRDVARLDLRLSDCAVVVRGGMGRVRAVFSVDLVELQLLLLRVRLDKGAAHGHCGLVQLPVHTRRLGARIRAGRGECGLLLLRQLELHTHGLLHLPKPQRGPARSLIELHLLRVARTEFGRLRIIDRVGGRLALVGKLHEHLRVGNVLARQR